MSVESMNNDLTCMRVLVATALAEVWRPFEEGIDLAIYISSSDHH